MLSRSKHTTARKGMEAALPVFWDRSTPSRKAERSGVLQAESWGFGAFLCKGTGGVLQPQELVLGVGLPRAPRGGTHPAGSLLSRSRTGAPSGVLETSLRSRPVGITPRSQAQLGF